jgi:hypothetical protein
MARSRGLGDVYKRQIKVLAVPKSIAISCVRKLKSAILGYYNYSSTKLIFFQQIKKQKKIFFFVFFGIPTILYANAAVLFCQLNKKT